MAAHMEKCLQLFTNELLADATDTFYEDYVNIIAAATEEEERCEDLALGTARITDYVEKTVPTYSDPMFRAHFRMTRPTFEELLHAIAPYTESRGVSLEKKTLACVWYVSNSETFRSVADRFGFSKGSLHHYIRNFCKNLTETNLLSEIISWPKAEEYDDLATQNLRRAGFPGAIGFLDGTLIPIPGPSQFRDSYICRKGFPAMQLQAVCDSNLKFIDVYCAYPGSVHDARVFRNSPLATKLQKDLLPSRFHLLGDSAYGLSPYLLVLYRDNGHLNPDQKRYNNAHSSTRVDIERSFGLLKGKFRKLKHLDMKKVRDMPHVIVACCVLHKFILEKEQYTDSEIQLDNDGAGGNQESDTIIHQPENRSGVQKRMYITRILP